MGTIDELEKVNKDFYRSTTDSSLDAKKTIYATFDYESYIKVFPPKAPLTRAQKRKIIFKFKKQYQNDKNRF